MDKKNKTEDNKKNDLHRPDSETLHTTDPQEHMEGPVSTLVQDVRKIGEKNKPESKEIKHNKP
jgi:hypothetical protein